MLQELALRLLRQGRSRQPPRNQAGRAAAQGNIPHRYLDNRRHGSEARFRTYLKRVIRNLIEEYGRHERRQPVPLDPADADVAGRAADSVSAFFERHGALGCLPEAARRFRDECRAARTRGERRLFDVFYLATARGLKPAVIARQLGLDRSTVAEQLNRARKRFVGLLGELSGVADPDELRAQLSVDPAKLVEALDRARAENAS